MRFSEEPLPTNDERIAAIKHEVAIARACDRVADVVGGLLTLLTDASGKLNLSEEFAEDFRRMLERVYAIHDDAYHRHLQHVLPQPIDDNEEEQA